MVDARSIPASVLWHEGMLLSPQHFQQADLRQQVQQSYMMLTAAPYCWGVRHLTLDKAALVGGTFSVTGLEAVMPDGLPVWHSADADPTAPKLELDLKPFAAAPSPTRSTVHLTVAVRSTSAVRADEQQRFRQIEDRDVPDENTGDNGISIPRLVPFLSLHVTDGPLRPPPSRFVSLPLAVLECGARSVTPIEYEPPRFRVDQESMLFRLGSRVLADLRGKATEWGVRLSGALAEGQAGIANESSNTLRMLVRGLPRLEVLLATEATHPFDLYLALCDIAGNLCAPGGRMMLPAFGAYLHADPLTPFKAVVAYLDQALQQLRTPYRSIPFGHPDRDRFVLLMEPDHLRMPSLVIGARLGPGQDVASVRAWFDTAVIGAASRVAALRTNAVIGAARSATGSAPEFDLFPAPGMVLFRVAVEAGLIAAGETLEISQRAVEGVTEPAELRLYLPAAAGSGAP